MHAEILTIGDELCRGEIVDTNSSYLAQRLWDLDITTRWMTSCCDDAEDITAALAQAVRRADVVVCSGGLGPTEDDLTVDVVAKLAGVDAAVDETARQRMEMFFARIPGGGGAGGLAAIQLRQVRVPAGARVLGNPAGLAPCFEQVISDVPVFCLPGIPRELHAIFDQALGARLAELREAAGDVERIARRIYRTFGRGESQISQACRGVLASPALPGEAAPPNGGAELIASPALPGEAAPPNGGAELIASPALPGEAAPPNGGAELIASPALPGEAAPPNGGAELIDNVVGASIHYQVKFPETLVKLVVRDRDQAAADARLASLDAAIRERLAGVLYGTGEDNLVAIVTKKIIANKTTVATAESCTGGMIGELLTNLPGSSAAFVGGAITYSNAEKVRALGVSQATLDAHGAVSEETVREMATGARERFATELAVAVSGIAGPDGGTPDKPVGTVWLALASPHGITTKKLSWPGSREQIRQLAAWWGLKLVLDYSPTET